MLLRLQWLLMLIYNPARAMARIAAAAPYVFGALLALVATVLYSDVLSRQSLQDYAPLVSCALYAWAMAQLLMIVPALTIYQSGGPNPQMTETILRQLAPLPYFLFLMIFALRAAMRLSVGRAAGAMALGACSLVAMGLMSSALLRLLTSPFLFIMVILLLRNFFGDLIGAQRAREEFKRH